MTENNEKEDVGNNFLPGYSTAEAFNKEILRLSMMLTKTSNSLPNAGGDWDYYSSFPGFSKATKFYGQKLSNLMTEVYSHFGVVGHFNRLDADEKAEFFSDGNDVLMEKINISLDEAAGIKKQVETITVETSKQQNLSGSWNRRSTGSQNNQSIRLLSAKNIQRPQLKFKEKIDNRVGPFVPKIKEKPNAAKPLAILIEIDDLGNEEYSHPYEFELERFTPRPEQLQLNGEPEKYPDLESTPLIFVDNENVLSKMIQDLTSQSEIAVDLEHHSYRTFQGLTCLMQISTRKTDYIVDTLQLWDQLQPLNEVFTNPKIVKVFHGADKDVEWLQRDLGVYLVNMFDTYQAAKLLNYQHLSLAYLVHHHCQVKIDKQFQLADWRIRPLPDEMVFYARTDTHYLLYIYDRLRKDLAEKSRNDNLLKAVWEASRQTCLKKYYKPIVREDTHMDLYRQSKKAFNERQLYVLRELNLWRDKVGREEDESAHYVLPKHMMLQIAEVLPREMQGILACCNPVPPLVRQHLLTLHNIVLKGRELPLTSIQNEGQPLVQKIAAPSVDQDTENPLYCPHDLTHAHDIRDDLPTLLGELGVLSGKSSQTRFRESSEKRMVKPKTSPQVTAFQERDFIAFSEMAPFTSPYMRYEAAKKVAQQELLEQQKAENQDVEQRVEKLHQHFLETVAGDPREEEAAPRQSEGSQATKQKKQKKVVEPLSKSVESRKRKKGKAPPKPSESSSASQATSPRAGPGTPQGKTPTPSKKPRNNREHRQQQAEVTPFDYSQVDYKEFQQGARHPGGKAGARRGRNKQKSRIASRGGGGQRSMTYSNRK